MSEQTSRVCFYCKETVTPANDPFHVHGCNECQCGVEPPHNQHLHDADPPLCRTCGQPVKSDRHGYGRHWPDGAETEPRPNDYYVRDTVELDSPELFRATSELYNYEGADLVERLNLIRRVIVEAQKTGSGPPAPSAERAPSTGRSEAQE